MTDTAIPVIPIETHIVHGGDSGTPFTELMRDESSIAIDSFNSIVDILIKERKK